MAWHWNWDSGVEPLQWIIRQDTCDRGTALLLYWYGGPRHLAQYAERGEVPEYMVEHYDLVREIEAAYLSGRYACAQIAFDPAPTMTWATTGRQNTRTNPLAVQSLSICIWPHLEGSWYLGTTSMRGIRQVWNRLTDPRCVARANNLFPGANREVAIRGISPWCAIMASGTNRGTSRGRSSLTAKNLLAVANARQPFFRISSSSRYAGLRKSGKTFSEYAGPGQMRDSRGSLPHMTHGVHTSGSGSIKCRAHFGSITCPVGQDMLPVTTSCDNTHNLSPAGSITCRWVPQFKRI